MIAGYHLVWTAYGWWLPNDPRGSSSHEIRVERIAELGELHHGRKRVQPAGAELRAFYTEARLALKHPLLTFDDESISIIADGIARVLQERGYTCYACAVMPDHVHALIRKHRDWAEQMIEEMQQASRTALIAAGKRAEDHPVQGGPGWKVFLNTRDDMERIVGYIENNDGALSRSTTAGSRAEAAKGVSFRASGLSFREFHAPRFDFSPAD